MSIKIQASNSDRPTRQYIEFCEAVEPNTPLADLPDEYERWKRTL